MAKKRDSAYYRQRLKRDYPAVFADLQAGRVKSVREAAARAGLIRIPGRLDALKREWKKASDEERQAFTAWVRSLSAESAPEPGPAPDPTPAGEPEHEPAGSDQSMVADQPTAPEEAPAPPPREPVPDTLVGPDGLLVPGIVGRVESILARRGIRPAPIMVPALRREWRPNPAFLERLKAWIEENEAG